jgi:hypothetical protein
MTDSQRKYFYFPIWSALAKACDWKMEGGRLLGDLDAQSKVSRQWPAHARGLLAEVIAKAQAAARPEQRSATADDLRHACNLVASGGRTASSSKFSQQHLNQFDRLASVLINPWDVSATIAWMNPEEDDRQRTLTYLRKLANEGRLRAIALNAWGVSDWETLDQARLDALQAEVKSNAWKKYPRKETAAQPF